MTDSPVFAQYIKMWPSSYYSQIIYHKLHQLNDIRDRKPYRSDRVLIRLLEHDIKYAKMKLMLLGVNYDSN